MFDRFSKQAVRTVHAAIATAHDEDSAVIDEEHLAQSLFREPGAPADVLAAHTIKPDHLAAAFAAAHRRGDISQTEIDTLRDLGVDVTEMVAAVERNFDSDVSIMGNDEPPRRRWFGRHLPISPDLKLVLEGAIEEYKKCGGRQIDDEHLLLALLARGGLAAGVLGEFGLTYSAAVARLPQR